MPNINPQTGALVPTYAERKQFAELVAMGQRAAAHNRLVLDAAARVAAMTPAERVQALAAVERRRLQRWLRDPRTQAHLKARELPILRG